MKFKYYFKNSIYPMNKEKIVLFILELSTNSLKANCSIILNVI